MSARSKLVGRVPSHGATVKDAPNAASGDAAYNAAHRAPVGRVPSRGAAPTGRKKIAQRKERSDAALRHESENAASSEEAKEMRGLPSGWRWARMSEVCSRV